MRSISKILLPVDFSPRSTSAARYAAALAKHFHAELTVLNVLERFPWVPASAWEYSTEFEAQAELAFEEQRKRELESYSNDEFSGLQVKRLMVRGNAAEMIIRQSLNDHSDLIVMATRGCGKFRRFLLGSVTSKVLHDAACPVWTGVHMDQTADEDWQPIRQVLCAVDNSSESSGVLRWAADFSAEFGAQLSIVRAVPPLHPAAGGHFDPDWSILIGQTREDVSKTKLAAGVQQGDIRIEEGQPAEAIARVAAQLGAAVVVIGRNPVDTVIGRLLEDAYAIIRESPCPVVSV